MILLFLSMFILFFIGVPISMSIGFASILWFINNDIPLAIVITRLFRSLNTFPLLAVPFFMLTGGFLSKGGAAKKLIILAEVLVGSFKGGLAQVNILVSMFFAGITGSASADTSAVGSLLIPSMIEEGYEKDYSVVVTATSSVIGVLIPPSIPIVIAAISANVSIGALLLAGIIPGILVGLALMCVTYIIAHKRNYIAHKLASRKEIKVAIINAFPPLIAVIIIVGGIYSGVFTPTESAVVAAIYSLFLGVIVYKKIKLKDFFEILIYTCVIGGSALFLYANASIFGWIVATAKLPSLILNIITDLTTNAIAIQLLIIFFLLLVGTIMDTSPAILILMPILLPISSVLGLHPVHFAFIVTMGLSIGLVTPPVGCVLFVACNIADISIDKTIIALIPYLIALIAILLLVTFIPEIALYIPRLVFPKL